MRPDAQKSIDTAPVAGPSRDAVAAAIFQVAARGGIDALGRLYDLLGKELFGYIRGIVGTQSDAEDVFQEVFARLAAQGGKLARVERPISYTFTIARNEAYKTLKKRSGLREAALEEGLLEAAPLDAKEPALSPREAQRALGTLPVEQREVVVLKIYEGFTFAEIAALTGVSQNTAASRYRYAVEKLAEAIGRMDGRK